MARLMLKESGRVVMDPRVCETNMDTFLTDVLRDRGNNTKFGVLIDDLETLSAPVRAKLLATLTKQNPTVPVICICTDAKDKAVATFAKACGTSVKMAKPKCASNLIRKHAPAMPDPEVKSIERVCNGDLRQAVILTVQAMTWKRHQSVVLSAREARTREMYAKLPPQHSHPGGALGNRSDAKDRRVNDHFSATELSFVSKKLDDVLTCITYSSLVPVMIQEHLVKKMGGVKGTQMDDITNLCNRLEDMSSGDVLDSHWSHSTHEHASHQYASACMGMKASSATRVTFPQSLGVLSMRNGNRAAFSEVESFYSRRFVSHEDEDMVKTLIRARMDAGEAKAMLKTVPKQTVKKFKEVKFK
jgi:hypothetical protein